VAFFGFGVAAWIVIMGAFCVLVGSMVWMMVVMGRNARHRR
jgi:hypothetical protein